ncbi:SusD/RagB family nutrient-binding outer membrane lipoprotein [Algivirga pacifica]|uniref:SusD/RagB family nutrient-binding outer membrane lipoprotein n=1 Tax=Algivirga pacifica TaxID=1162670 RepID=A0ABP9D9A8_9BACT
MNTIKHTISIGLLTIASVLGLNGCTDHFDELNSNPNATTDIEPKYLLSRAMVKGVGDYTTYYYTQHYASFLSQYFTNTNPGHITDAYFHSDPWNATLWSRAYAQSYRGFLGLADHAMKKAHEKELDYQEGQAKILRALWFLRLTDTFGDIPYSEAFSADDAENPILTPRYDEQEAVYTALFLELDEAVQLLSSAEGGARMGGNDLLLNDDLLKWQRFANSLRLRMAMRISLVAPAKAEEEFNKALSATGGVMESNLDNVGLLTDPAGPAGFQHMNPLKVNANQFPRWYRVSETAVHYLETLNDPRIERYAAPRLDYLKGLNTTLAQINSDALSPEEQQFHAEAKAATQTRVSLFEKPYGYMDQVESFLGEQGISLADQKRYKGVRNGQSPSTLSQMQDQLNDYSELGEYLRQDDFKIYLITYPEVCFLKAEAALRFQNDAVTASVEYEKGVRASMDMYAIPELTEDDTNRYEAYLNGPAAFKSTGSTEEQIAQVITQKWIANYSNGFEAWAEWRRTGYPQLFQINSTGDTEGVLPRRWMYIIDEFRYNQESVEAASERIGGNTMMQPMWWDSQYKDKPAHWDLME